MRSSLKSNLKVSLLSLVLIFSLTEASLAHRHASYSHDGGRQTCQPCWMKYLKDDVRLSELSIPGTHDTMAFYGGDLAQAQSMGLRFQLESGIRVLDIRCRHVRNRETRWVNRFRIYHGFVDQRVWFYEVLNTVVKFLEDYPHETVLMRVKEEHTPLNVTRSFAETFRVEYWEKYIKHMWQPVEAGVDPANPTLREMQGKIVILQDFDRDNQKYGMAYSSFDYQDHYNLENDGELYDKWLKVDRHLAAANSGPRETKYINYLSASNRAGRVFPYFVVSGHSDSRTSAPNKATGRTSPGFRGWPEFPRVACADVFGVRVCTIAYEGTNTLTYGRLGPGGYAKRVGLIMTDFPGWGLINRIIDVNKDHRKPNQPLECDERNPRRCAPPPKPRRSK